jgi:hypothetical protein
VKKIAWGSVPCLSRRNCWYRSSYCSHRLWNLDSGLVSLMGRCWSLAFHLHRYLSRLYIWKYFERGRGFILLAYRQSWWSTNKAIINLLLGWIGSSTIRTTMGHASVLGKRNIQG